MGIVAALVFKTCAAIWPQPEFYCEICDLTFGWPMIRRRLFIVGSLCIGLCLMCIVFISTEIGRSALNKAVVEFHLLKPIDRQRSELRKIKADMLSRFKHLGELRGRDLVRAIEEIANREITIGSSPGNLEDDLYGVYSDAVVKKSTSYSCQGVALIFRTMLSAFGIRNRAVLFYATVEQLPNEVINSHASVDVLLDGRWEAIDPTFDFHLVGGSGHRLDWLSAYNRLKEGLDVIVVPNDPSLKTDPLKRAGIDLKRDMTFVAFIDRKVMFLPANWTGVYRIKGRLYWNVADSYSADRNLPEIVAADVAAAK